MSIPPPLIHNMALKYKPELPMKAKNTWVAILRHDVKTPNDIQEMANFLFMKCHAVCMTMQLEWKLKNLADELAAFLLLF